MARALGIRAVGVTVVVAFAVLATGCAGVRSEGESGNVVPLPESMPLCSDLFQPNKTIEEASFGRACRSASDELVVPRYVRLDCDDDSTLVWNDFAWGYVGQPMTLFDPNAAVRMPTTEAMTCRADAGTDLQSLVERRIEQLEEIEDQLDQAEDIADERILVGASQAND